MEHWQGQFGDFVEQVRADVLNAALAERQRFPSVDTLVRRFEDAAESLLINGPDSLKGFEEVHNELCVAILILEASNIPCTRLEYEPAMSDCPQRFDFGASFKGRPIAWVEVKTIHPDRIDSWEQYERLLRQGRFPENASLYLEQQWLGGELFHKYFAARAKLLSYTIETEDKVSQCLAEADRGRVFLVFFSNGFDWHVNHLEDFLYFYRYGHHFEGDHFRAMEEHHIKSNGLCLKRNIQHFGFMRRSTAAIRPTMGAWDVEPVRWSPTRGFE